MYHFDQNLQVVGITAVYRMSIVYKPLSLLFGILLIQVLVGRLDRTVRKERKS